MSRRTLAADVFSFVGAPPLHVRNLLSGWPALGSFRTSDGRLAVALHVAPATNYFRKAHEFRFQNPTKREPVVGNKGFPLLLGVAIAPVPILVGLDGRSRVGRKRRFSILFNKNIIPEAAKNGFAKYISRKGEAIYVYAFRPSLFAAFMEIVTSGVIPEASQVAALAKAAVILDNETPAASERVRRATKVLVRQQAFGQKEPAPEICTRR